MKGTGYPLHSPVSPFTSPPARHRVPSHFNWSLLLPHFVFRRNGPVHLNLPGGGRQFIRLLAAELCGISGSNAAYSVFRGSVKSTGDPLHSPVSPLTSPPVRHRVPSRFDWTLLSLAYSCDIAAKRMAHLSLFSRLEMNGPVPPLPTYASMYYKTQTGFAFREYFSVVSESSVGYQLSLCCYSKHRADV